MFEVEYKGANCVTVSSKKATIVVDLKLSEVGLKDASVKDAVELGTEDRFTIRSEDARLVIEGPGEYGIADFDIRGVAAQRHLDTELDPKKSTMYTLIVNDIRVAIIGNVYEKLTEDQLELLGVVDILIIPVGGNGYTLDATGASTIVRQIGPKAVIPVHYADPTIKYEVPQDDISVFTGELGAPVEELPKLKLKGASSLPQVLTVYKLDRV